MSLALRTACAVSAGVLLLLACALLVGVARESSVAFVVPGHLIVASRMLVIGVSVVFAVAALVLGLLAFRRSG
jgi:hypothetical protein